MTHLIATGIDDQQHWRRKLQMDEVVRLGRAPRQGWAIPWDLRISREHADIKLVEFGLQVTVLETAHNPILYRNQQLREFTASPGEKFQIGHTIFQFHDIESSQSPSTELSEFLYSSRDIQALKFKDSKRCLESLCEIPRLMSETMSDKDFATELVGLLLNAMPNVTVAAAIQFDDSADYDAPEPKLVRWDSGRNSETRFKPSRRLMAKVLQRRCTAIHLWEENRNSSKFTMSGDLDWAFCTPIPTNQDRWCIYVSGRRTFEGLSEVNSPVDLISELRFAELVANFIGAAHKVRSLERQQSEMTQYFSPSVVESLLKNQSSSLEPSEGMTTVLFCDIQGFSRKVEQARGQLDQLLKRISHALNIMTQNILRFEGVIADFQGDSSLAFWGWPTPLDDDPLSACRTAMAIQRAFYLENQDSELPLYGYHVSIAIGYGLAITGRIGSEQQTKVGVFGPVVNLTSRLENISKRIGASIVVDGEMAEIVRNILPPSEARLRFIARMRAQGLDDATDVYQLLPVGIGLDHITDKDIAIHEQAAQSIIAGDWGEAQQLLAGFHPDDGPANFLRALIADHNATPPANWDGAINLI